MNQMTDRMAKAAYPSINQSDIENLKIRVPEEYAQNTLVQELDELESRIQSARVVIASAPARQGEVLQEAVLKIHQPF